MDFFNQGFPLGRWFGVPVVINWMFFITVLWIMRMFSGNLPVGIMIVGLFFITVLLHEFGHATGCRLIGSRAKLIIIGPLGGATLMDRPTTAARSLVTTACGPLVNAILWPVFWAATIYGIPALAHVMNPNTMAFDLIARGCYAMWLINQFLLLFNLIPAYPMDGGRLLQEFLWLGLGFQKSLQIAGMVGTVAGAALVVLGLGLFSIRIPVVEFELGQQPDVFVCIIGALCALQSFGIYQQSRQLDQRRNNTF